MNCGSCGTENPAEERRQVTVLFADLSGYTAVAERMDPEAVKALVDRALMRLGQEVERYGGTVDKYIGDNVMAIFGAPVAHEDDAERAVRAGLGMQAAMEEINDGLPSGVHFDLRVGVNTGEVLAGAVGASYTVTGDTVNVAARLQSAARPGSVTVGERSMRATLAAGRYDKLEPLALKGKSEPVPAWEAAEVIAEHAVGRTAPARESPLVGEAGVGKSRVLRELERRLCGRPDAPAFHTGRCLPYGAGIVFWALGEVIRAGCGIVDSDSADVAWGKLLDHSRKLFTAEHSDLGEEGERRPAPLGRLIGLQGPPELVPESDDPERMRDAFFSALRSGIEAWAREKPLVFAFEDIHWADDGMLDAIEHLAQWVRAPLLIVCLARDELLDRRPGWGGGRRSATQLILDPLEPFERRLVQQASVVGRTFWEGSLLPLARSEGRDLGRALTTLQEQDILAPGAEGRLAGERELAFKHVLIRDVAYGMLPKAVRARKHFEVGSFIEERAGDRTDEVVPLLAEHYGRAAALGREGGLPADEL